MKALFLGGVAADTFAGIKDELPSSLQCEILNDPIDRDRLPEAAVNADILVSNRWLAEYPPAPKLRLVQSVATGVELIDLATLPRGCTVCNSFGHETAIAEYVVMAMLALHHRFFQIAGEFRERGSWATSWVQSGKPHGEVRGSTLGIVGYGRVGREVARRAAPFGCRILAANRSHATRNRVSSASIRSRNWTGCCRNATRWRSAPHSGPRRRGLSMSVGWR